MRSHIGPPGAGTGAGEESRFKAPQQLEVMALPCQALLTANVIQLHRASLLLLQALVAAGELFALG